MFKGFLPFIRQASFLIAIFYCFHGAVFELRASRHYRKVATWPTTEALISSSEVFQTNYSWNRYDRACPKLAYSYRVAGVAYEAYNKVSDFACWSDASDFVAQHRPGTSIRIAYDPGNPAISVVPDAVRDPGYPWENIAGGTFFVVAFLIDVFRSWNASNDRRFGIDGTSK